jgi:hypothetical protein
MPSCCLVGVSARGGSSDRLEEAPDSSPERSILPVEVKRAQLSLDDGPVLLETVCTK